MGGRAVTTLICEVPLEVERKAVGRLVAARAVLLEAFITIQSRSPRSSAGQLRAVGLAVLRHGRRSSSPASVLSARARASAAPPRG